MTDEPRYEYHCPEGWGRLCVNPLCRLMYALHSAEHEVLTRHGPRLTVVHWPARQTEAAPK